MGPETEQDMGKGVCSVVVSMSYFWRIRIFIAVNLEDLNSSAFSGTLVAILWHHREGYGGNAGDARGRLVVCRKTPREGHGGKWRGANRILGQTQEHWAECAELSPVPG